MHYIRIKMHKSKQYFIKNDDMFEEMNIHSCLQLFSNLYVIRNTRDV